MFLSYLLLGIIAIVITITLSLIPLYLPKKSISSKASSLMSSYKSGQVIIDNDWFGSASFIPVLILLSAQWEILGLTVVVGNSWVDHATLHVLRFLELSNRTRSIPVYKGARYPLLNTPFRMDRWQQLYGKIPWTGAFTEQNLTAESMGMDPTGGDPTRIVLSALPEGLPTTKEQEMHAVNFLIEQVHRYPGQVSILALGTLTNIALAVKMNATFARQVKEIFIQGGYIDVDLAQTIGSISDADLHSDFNFLFDPEAASIVINADFPSIVLVGRASMMATYASSYIDEMTATTMNSFTNLISKYYPRNLPMWDEAAAALLAYPYLITNAFSTLADVDISYHSPFYGRTKIWQKKLAPIYARNVSFVHDMNRTLFFDLIKKAVVNV